MTFLNCLAKFIAGKASSCRHVSLVSVQEKLRQAERDARPSAAMKKRAEACEGKLREATSGQTQHAQELTQKLQQAEQGVRTAHARLKDRDRLYSLLEESAAAAEARAKSLEADLGREAAARAAATAAAEATQEDLSKARAAWEHDRAGLVAEKASAAAIAAKKVEELEGSLAECRGRVAGLGEGCGRCWQMLDEAQASAAERFVHLRKAITHARACFKSTYRTVQHIARFMLVLEAPPTQFCYGVHHTQNNELILERVQC